jgi:flagellar protein FliL
MADEDLDLDLSEGEGGSGGGKKKLIIIIAVVILLVGGGAAFFLMGGEDSAEQTAEGDEEAEEKEKPLAEAIFVSLTPAFIVNFPGKKTRYMQIDLSVMSRKQEVIDAITYHLPVIRNDLLVTIGSQSLAKLKTAKGKDELRQILLDQLIKIISEQAELEGVENVYFTKFVMQ